jgi:hypothetical protein
MVAIIIEKFDVYWINTLLTIEKLYQLLINYAIYAHENFIFHQSY